MKGMAGSRLDEGHKFDVVEELDALLHLRRDEAAKPGGNAFAEVPSRRPAVLALPRASRGSWVDLVASQVVREGVLGEAPVEALRSVFELDGSGRMNFIALAASRQRLQEERHRDLPQGERRVFSPGSWRRGGGRKLYRSRLWL